MNTVTGQKNVIHLLQVCFYTIAAAVRITSNDSKSHFLFAQGWIYKHILHTNLYPQSPLLSWSVSLKNSLFYELEIIPVH